MTGETVIDVFSLELLSGPTLMRSGDGSISKKPQPMLADAMKNVGSDKLPRY
jgi:hypothetical protein